MTFKIKCKMKKYRIVLVAFFASLVFPLSAQLIYGGLHATSDATYGHKKNVSSSLLGTHGSFLSVSASGISGVGAPSVALPAFRTTVQSSSLTTGSFVSADDYLMSNSPAMRRVGIPDPDGGDSGLVPLSEGMWFVLLLAMGYMISKVLSRRGRV